MFPLAIRHAVLYIERADGSQYLHDWDGPGLEVPQLKTNAPTPGALLPLWGWGTSPCSMPVWEEGAVTWFCAGVLQARVAAAWAAISAVNTALCHDDGDGRTHIFSSVFAWNVLASTVSTEARTVLVHNFTSTHCV